LIFLIYWVDATLKMRLHVKNEIIEKHW